MLNSHKISRGLLCGLHAAVRKTNLATSINKILLTALIFIFASFSETSFAAEKIAMCEVVSGGVKAFNGKCRFLPSKNGTFTLSNIDPSQEFIEDGIYSVSVYVTEKDVAEVSGSLTGSNSRWGTAVRSKSDRSCWVGSDFKVCAR